MPLRNFVYPLLMAVGLLSLTLVPATAQKSDKRSEAKPNESQIVAATKRLDQIPALRRASLNAARYLIRPAFQNEIINHESYLHCRARPISEKYKGKMTVLRTVRLLGILRSGMPLDEYADRDLSRMCDGSPDNAPGLLSGLGVQMLAAQAAWKRKPRGDVAKFAAEVLEAAQKRKIPTRLNSSFIKTDAIDPIWFGNHFWRAVIMRIAIDMGVPPSRKGIKEWGASLVLLGRTHVKGSGWTRLKNQPYDPSGDFHANLMAISAFRLAAGAPEGTFGKKATAAITKGLENAKPVMERLEKEYDKLEISSSRLFLLQATDGVPLSEDDRIKWDLLGAREAADGIRVDGYPKVRTSVPADLGFRVPSLPLLEETVLTLIMMTGGIITGKEPPLKGMKRSEIDEIWRAMAIVQFAAQKASGKLPGGKELQRQINKAINKGVGFLMALQLDDGSFEGIYSDSPANTAMVALALLHSGVSRDKPVIKKAMEFLERNDWNPDSGILFKDTTRSYALGILLMLLQKFHEPEQRAAGILNYKNPRQYLAARRKMWASLSKRRQRQVKRLLEMLTSARSSTKVGWGYGNAGPGRTPRPVPKNRPEDPRDPEGDRRPSPETEDRAYSDNSNSHFAMLGLKAASLLGVSIDADFYKKEARRLLDNFKPQLDIKPAVVFLRYYKNIKDGKSGVRYRVQPGGWGYGPTDPGVRPSNEAPKRLDAGEGDALPDPNDLVDPDRAGNADTRQFSVNTADIIGQAGDEPPGAGQPILLRCKGRPGGVPRRPGKRRDWPVNIGMTSAGVSSLAICLEELILQRALDLKLEQEIKLTMSAALVFIGEIYYPYPKYLEGQQIFRRTPWRGFMDFDAIGNYHDLYAVERACTHSGAPDELIDDIDWYRIGAALLVKLQKQNGEWPRGVEETRVPGAVVRPGVATFNCCFALLFLERAALPVITPYPIPLLKKPRNPITEGPKEKPEDDPEEEEEEEEKPKDPITQDPKKKKKK